MLGGLVSNEDDGFHIAVGRMLPLDMIETAEEGIEP
jgi:hypothetical protein